MFGFLYTKPNIFSTKRNLLVNGCMRYGDRQEVERTAALAEWCRRRVTFTLYLSQGSFIYHFSELGKISYIFYGCILFGFYAQKPNKIKRCAWISTIESDEMRIDSPDFAAVSTRFKMSSPYFFGFLSTKPNARGIIRGKRGSGLHCWRRDAVKGWRWTSHWHPLTASRLLATTEHR